MELSSRRLMRPRTFQCVPVLGSLGTAHLSPWSVLQNCQGVRGMREGGIRQLYVPVRHLIHRVLLAIITSHLGSLHFQQTLGRTEL